MRFITFSTRTTSPVRPWYERSIAWSTTRSALTNRRACCRVSSSVFSQADTARVQRPPRRPVLQGTDYSARGYRLGGDRPGLATRISAQPRCPAWAAVDIWPARLAESGLDVDERARACSYRHLHRLEDDGSVRHHLSG